MAIPRSKRTVPVSDYCLKCGTAREVNTRATNCTSCRDTIFVTSLEFVKWEDMMRPLDVRFLRSLRIAPK